MAYLNVSCNDKKSLSNNSDEAIIYDYIVNNGYDHAARKNESPFLVTTTFRRYPEETDSSNFAARKDRISRALLLEFGTSMNKSLSVDCLATPNNSAGMLTLKKKVEGTGSVESSTLLTYSKLCVGINGKHYYYVERTHKNSRFASGDVFVVNKGVVEREISIWIT